MSLNNGTCMVKPTLIDLILIELNYYPFMIALGKCNGSLQCCKWLIYENVCS